MIKKLLEAYNKNQYIVFLILSIVLGFVPTLWFKDKIIAGEEFYSLNYQKWGEVYSAGWAPYVNFGEASILASFKLQGLFFSLATLLRVNYLLSLILWHVLLWVSTSVTFYIFLHKLLQKYLSPALIFIGTVLYVFNPYFLNISVFLTPARIIFIFQPLLFLYLISWLDGKARGTRYVIYFALISFFSSPAFVNLPAGFVLFMPLVFYFLFAIFFIKDDVVPMLKSGVLLITLVITINLWWILPTASSIYANMNALQSSGSSFSAINRTRLSDVLSQFGSWAFREKVGGTDYFYFPYSYNYDRPPLLILKFIPLVLIVLGMILVIDREGKVPNRETRIFSFISLFYVILVFLTKGTSGIGGSIFELVYFNIPFIWIYREPYAKFGPLLSLCAVTLTMYGLVYILEFLKNSQLGTNIKRLLVFLFPLLLLLAFVGIGYPFITSSVVWRVNDGDVRSYEVERPPYWEKLVKEWAPKGGNYLLVPSNGYVDKYEWESGYIGNPYLMDTEARTLNPSSGYLHSVGNKAVISYLYDNVAHYPERFVSESGRYNISGFIIQGDTTGNDSMYAKSILHNLYPEYLMSQYGPIDIYEISGQDTLVTLLKNPVILRTDPESVDNYSILRRLFDPNTYFAIESDQKNLDLIELRGIDRSVYTQSETMEYPLDLVEPGEYRLVIYGDKTPVYGIKYGDQELLTEKQLPYVFSDIDISENCCDSISIDFGDSIPAVLTKDWKVVYSFGSKHKEYKVYEGKKMDLTAKDVYYELSLPEFDSSSDHVVLLEGILSGQAGVEIRIVQRNLSNNSDKTISSEKVQLLNGSTTVNLLSQRRADPLQESEYFLQIRPDIPDHQVRYFGSYLELSNIEMYRVNSLEVFLLNKRVLKREQPGTIVERMDYHRISNNVLEVFINTTPTENGVELIQFKESFNPFWRLVKIGEGDPTLINEKRNKLLDTLKIMFSVAQNSKPPMNIESYSNGWVLNDRDSHSQSVYAIVYLPGVALEFLFAVTLSVVIITSIALAVQKKNNG